MRHPLLALTLLLPTALALTSPSNRLQSLHAAALRDRATAARARHRPLADEAPQRRSLDASSPYHTNATAAFAVDGAAFPNVTFDIGESYAGLLPIDDGDSGRELFFWFVPTANEAADEEIVIWLNGGPGCSSMYGFFKENGPVNWMAGQYQPVKNHYAWTNVSNVVWIEQPVGTGYSRGKPNATSEADVAAQFAGFWKNFVDLFELQNRKVYITGESYAGMYVPYIADHMIELDDPTYFNVSGIMIYDPSIGHDTVTGDAPTLSLVDNNRPSFPFNDTFSEHIRNMSAACGYDDFVSEGLTYPPKGPFGPPPGAFPNGSVTPDCAVLDEVFTAIFLLNPCFNIYQVSQLCPIQWDVLGFPYSSFYFPPGYQEPYFNRSDVKALLHAPPDANWKVCTDTDVFVGDDGDTSPPSGLTGGPLARVAEATNNVIVGHGSYDMVLILNGTLLTLQNLTWNGAQGFSAPPDEPFYVPYHDAPFEESLSGAGVFGSWGADRGLTFVAIELAGHAVPGFTQAAGLRHLELLLGRIGNLSEVSGFSTQPGYPQPDVPLGRGTTPVQAVLGGGGYGR
ncbi:alpha/beta-hydrolase [Neofusicoccum parvum]|uniref:Alpha/beta-hydrolase n=1 Tax=Neofusicoccum parvum TaxID=310453 RepID=A0ACB5S929_9PEZI|nr:alpha/beta-hydrolase [Neofusicoccum parvum]